MFDEAALCERCSVSMSRRLLMMLIFIISRLKSKFMASSSSLNHVEDCFYEKRRDTSLHDYNYLPDHWISELDCLERCLKVPTERCSSFEHWRSNRYELCVRANISLSEQPLAKRTNLFVDYYEIDCRKDVKAVRPQITTCPGDQLHLLISLNGIDPNYVLLGDDNCKPTWSNETHAQFATHVDNCSLILMEGSIVGKLRWEGVVKDTSEAKQYERFFLCPSDIYRIRLADWTSTTVQTMSNTSATATFRNSLSTVSASSSRSRPAPTRYHDGQVISTAHGISLQWMLRNRTYSCPQSCSVPLYSLIHVTIDDLSVYSSQSLIDSCELKALYPYSNYFHTRRLIQRGCSMDPSIIHFPAEMDSLSTFSFFFYLYNILKEPIPFQIQCHVLAIPGTPSNCSLIEEDPFLSRKHDRADYLSPTVYHSSSVNVIRQVPTNLIEQPISSSSNPVASIVTVHSIECSFFLLVVSFSSYAIGNRYAKE